MRRWKMFLPTLLIGWLAACAGQMQGAATPTPPAQLQQSPEEALRARATQFWEARVKGDLAAQYDLLEPPARERVTLTGFYRSRSSVVFQSYKIQEVEAAGDEGWVTAMTTFRMNLPQVSRFGPWDQGTIMHWIRVNGVWYVGYDQQNVKKPLKAEEKKP